MAQRLQQWQTLLLPRKIHTEYGPHILRTAKPWIWRLSTAMIKMKQSLTLSVLLAATATSAFPHIADKLGMKRCQVNGNEGFGEAFSSPVERRYTAAPITDELPYNGAKNGLPSLRKGISILREQFELYICSVKIGSYTASTPGQVRFAMLAPEQTQWRTTDLFPRRPNNIHRTR